MAVDGPDQNLVNRLLGKCMGPEGQHPSCVGRLESVLAGGDVGKGEGPRETRETEREREREVPGP